MNDLIRFTLLLFMGLLFWISVGLLIFAAITEGGECVPEPASQWAPPGYVCSPVYGEGIASTYPGSGVARNDCTYPFTACQSIVITSLTTGAAIIRTPVTWCMCWVRVTGPNGETERIVDLDLSSVAALGLDPSAGLWPVRVERFDGILPGLPNTTMSP